MTDTIKAIQKQIVAKLEVGEDVSELTRRLAQERARIAAQIEVEELKKIVDERQQLRDKAAKVQEKVKLQGEAIDAFLKVRDAIITPLAELVEKARDLPKLQSECYAQYHDAFVFGGDMRQIPKGYLLADFNCPILDMASGVSESYDVAAQAFFYLQSGLGLLANLTKGEMTIPGKPAGEFDGELEPETESGSCIVCSHPEVEAINSLLRQGKPLRDIEAEFDVSRSSLSRHKNNCLNLGAVRVREDAL